MKNPCAVRGAGTEHAPERPVATVAEVYTLADAIEPPFRVLVLIGAFLSLRLGELRGLQRQDFDLLHAQVHVRRQVQDLKGQGVDIRDPKSRAGVRTLAIPAALVPEIEAHLASFTAVPPESFVFGDGMTPFRRARLYKAWGTARAAVGAAAAVPYS